MSDITQSDVDAGFKELKAAWDKKFKGSCARTVSGFIMADKDKFAVNTLAQYQQVKEGVEAEGLIMPVLVEGTTIILSEDE